MDERIVLKQRIKQDLNIYYQTYFFSAYEGLIDVYVNKYIFSISGKNDHERIKQFEQAIDYSQTDIELFEKCVSFYESNDVNSLFCKFIQEIFIDINKGKIHLRNIAKDVAMENVSKVLGSGNFSIINTNAPEQKTNQIPAWKKYFDDASKSYARVKGAFYSKDFQNAISFFQQTKDCYKNALCDKDIDNRSRQKAKARIAKMKDDPNEDIRGKYSISNCK
jgi:hypothetical protein